MSDVEDMQKIEDRLFSGLKAVDSCHPGSVLIIEKHLKKVRAENVTRDEIKRGTEVAQACEKYGVL